MMLYAPPSPSFPCVQVTNASSSFWGEKEGPCTVPPPYSTSASVTRTSNVPSPSPLPREQVTDASFSLRGNGDVLATAAEDGVVRVWDTRVGLLEASPFPRSVACLRAFRAAADGSSALSRVLVWGADTALVTGDEENRLLKVIHIYLFYEVRKKREQK